MCGCSGKVRSSGSHQAIQRPQVNRANNQAQVQRPQAQSAAPQSSGLQVGPEQLIQALLAALTGQGGDQAAALG